MAFFLLSPSGLLRKKITTASHRIASHRPGDNFHALRSGRERQRNENEKGFRKKRDNKKKKYHTDNRKVQEITLARSAVDDSDLSYSSSSSFPFFRRWMRWWWWWYDDLGPNGQNDHFSFAEMIYLMMKIHGSVFFSLSLSILFIHYGVQYYTGLEERGWCMIQTAVDACAHNARSINPGLSCTLDVISMTIIIITLGNVNA